MDPGLAGETAGIPMDWQVVNIGSLANIMRGASPRPIDSSVWFDNQSRIGWLRISDVTVAGKYLEHTAKNLSALGIANSRFVKKGSLVMSICATVGRPVITKKDVCIHDGFVVFDNLRANNEYIYYTLLNIEASWFKRGQTGSQMNLNTDLINSTTIPLPHLPEQRAIAETLSDVDNLLQSLEVLIAKKRAIKQTTMQQLLTGKTRLPGFTGPWETTQLGDLGAFSKGRGIRRDDVSDEGVPCIRYGELYTRYKDYVLKPVARIPLTAASESLPIKSGDLLFAGSGETSGEIGSCAAYLGKEQAYVGGDVVVLTPLSQNSLYLGYLMNHPIVTAQKARMAQGDAVVHISSRNLAQVRIDLPPLEEQASIAAALSDMDAEISALEQRMDKTRALKQGMMQQLLTGRIRLPKTE